LPQSIRVCQTANHPTRLKVQDIFKDQVLELYNLVRLVKRRWINAQALAWLYAKSTSWVLFFQLGEHPKEDRWKATKYKSRV
jgi:hypothetical protein